MVSEGLGSGQRKTGWVNGTIQTLLKKPTQEHISKLYHLIKDFRNWEVSELHWPVLFMKDSELNWLNGSVPVADL